MRPLVSVMLTVSLGAALAACGGSAVGRIGPGTTKTVKLDPVNPKLSLIHI